VWFARYASGQTARQTRSSQYFAPHRGASNNPHVAELWPIVKLNASTSLYRSVTPETIHAKQSDRETRSGRKSTGTGKGNIVDPREKRYDAMALRVDDLFSLTVDGLK